MIREFGARLKRLSVEGAAQTANIIVFNYHACYTRIVADFNLRLAGIAMEAAQKSRHTCHVKRVINLKVIVAIHRSHFIGWNEVKHFRRLRVRDIELIKTNSVEMNYINMSSQALEWFGFENVNVATRRAKFPSQVRSS